MLTLMLWIATHAATASEGDDEYYLLGDYGVRIDLPDDWSSLSWSDAALEAETKDRTLKLFVWAEPVQVTPVQADLDAWASVYTDKVDAIGGSDPAVQSTRLVQRKERPTARVELTFGFGEELAGAMSGATFAVAGHDLHIAIITRQDRGRLASQAIDMVLDRAEVRRPALPLTGLDTVESAGMHATLPDGWRTPLPGEEAVIVRVAEAFTDDLSHCWTALRPHAAADPDLLVTCPTDLRLGVVDTYSFDAVDEVLRARLFPGIDVPPAVERTTADGRTAFEYEPPPGAHALRLGVVPYGQGIARTWAFGAASHADALDDAISTLITTATYEGEHPVGPADVAGYWLTHRRTSPPVIGGALGLLGLLGGLGFALTRRRSPYDLDDV